MSDDVFLLHLCFFVNSVQKMCASAPYSITIKTRILGAHIVRLFLSISQVYLNVIKYISEEYIKSRLKVYFPLFSLKEVY